jgi:hypothetical protein
MQKKSVLKPNIMMSAPKLERKKYCYASVDAK